jgi:VanZ family protein
MLFLCGIPGSKLPRIGFWSFLPADKLAHVFLHFVFSILLIVGFSRQYSYSEDSVTIYFYSVLISFAYGVVIEFLQATIFIGRGADIFDMLANFLGAVAGCLSLIILKKKLL